MRKLLFIILLFPVLSFSQTVYTRSQLKAMVLSEIIKKSPSNIRLGHLLDSLLNSITVGGVAWGEVTGSLVAQTDLQTALNLKANLISPTFTGTVSGITKTMVGLGSVDNTTDLGKPISTATQAYVDNATVSNVLNSARLLVGSGANVATARDITGVISLSNTGVTSVTTPRTINGTTFDMSSDITITAATTYTTSTITAGSSSTLSAATYQIVYFDPASLLASYTLTTPASPSNNDIIEINAGGTIAALATVVTSMTVTANAGQAIYGSITLTQLKGGDRVRYQYNSTQTKWNRIL